MAWKAEGAPHIGDTDYLDPNLDNMDLVAPDTGLAVLGTGLVEGMVAAELGQRVSLGISLGRGRDLSEGEWSPSAISPHTRKGILPPSHCTDLSTSPDFCLQ